MALISRLGVVLGLDTAEFNANLGKAQEQVKKFAVGAGVIGTALGAAGLNALKFADQINDVAKANEVAVESVLELSTALTLNGGEADNVGKLFSSLSNKLDEASQGNLKTQKSFAKLGISISDIKSLNPDELFRKALASIASIENPITRNATAMDVFGKAVKGTDIKGLNEDLIKAKGTFDGAGESFKKAGEAFDIIDRIFLTMKAGFGEELAGAFNSWAKGAETFVKMLIEAKKGLLGLFEAGSILPKAGEKTTGGKGVIQDVFGSDTSALTLSMGKGDFEKYTGNDIPKTPNRTSPFKTTEELAKEEEERKKRSARLDKLKAENEVALAEANAKKIKDQEKLNEKINSQGIALERKLLLTQAETASVGKTLTETQKLNLEFEKGGSLELLKGTARAQALIDATKAKDIAVQNLEIEKQLFDNEQEKGKLKQSARQSNKQEVENLEIATERLNVMKGMAGQSDTQVQLALRYYDLQQQILEKKKEGLLTDQQLYDFAIASMDNIKAEEENVRAQNTFQAGWMKAYNNTLEKAQDSAALGAEAFNSMSNSMTSALNEFVETGKFSFSSLINSMIKDLLRMAMQAQVSGLFGMLTGGGGGGGLGSIFTTSSTDFANGGGILGFLGDIFRADGGDINANSPYIVGERGAELIVPRNAGTVIPNHALGSMMGNQPQTVYNGTVIQNMSAIDTQSGVQFLAKNKNAIFAANQSAQRGLPQGR